MKNDSMIIAGTIKLTQAAGSVFLKNKKQLSADVALFLENYIVMVHTQVQVLSDKILK
jgi:sRNA-binding regulator protein Hfq